MPVKTVKTRGKAPVVEPALGKIYGNQLQGKTILENIKFHFDENFQDMTAEEVTTQVNTDLLAAGEKTLHQGAIYSFAKAKLHWNFKKAARRRGSPVYDKFVETCGGEDKAKQILEDITSQPLKEAADDFNREHETEFSISNLRSFADKHNLEFKRIKRRRDPQAAGENVIAPPTKDPVKILYECRDCGHRSGSRTHDLPPQTKAKRCKGCNKWATCIATWEVDGETFRKATVEEHLGGNLVVKSDTLVDEDLNIINPTIPQPAREEIQAEPGESIKTRKTQKEAAITG